MSEDPFETVAIAYTQSQARVLLSLFEWNGIPAYGANLEMVRTVGFTLALGGIPIRVAREAAAEARAILREAEVNAGEEPASEPEPLGDRVTKAGLYGVMGMMAVAPPPRLSVEIIG